MRKTKYFDMKKLTTIFLCVYTINTYCENCIYFKAKFDNLISLSGINKFDYNMICSEDVKYASYSTINGHKTFNINKSFFSSYPEIVFHIILAHELGHYVYNHNNETTPDEEIQADIYCGKIMAKIGYRDIDNVLEVFQTLPADESKHYATREKRKNAVKLGWESVIEKEALPIVNFNPVIIWKFDKGLLNVRIDGNLYTSDTFYNHLIYFDSISKSTIQLIRNHQNRSSGIGRLVSNRTLITYRRTWKGYNIYENGIELEKIKCTENRATINQDGDIICNCKNKITNKYVNYKLKYFDIAPKKYAMPAYQIEDEK